jgi:hypothetical protein
MSELILNEIRLYRPVELIERLSSHVNEHLDSNDGEDDPLELLPGEIIIANIIFNSHSGDFHFVTACMKNDRICIDVRDEYDQVFFDFNNVFSKIPTQQDVFEILVEMKVGGSDDGRTYLEDVIFYNEFEQLEDILNFIIFSSDYYPDLRLLFENWLFENYKTFFEDKN